MAIESHELESGLRVLVDHMPHTYTTALNVYVDVGSIDERPEESGLSHAVEHCAFNGTPDYKDTKEIINYSRQNCFSVGANTSTKRTLYHTRGPELEPIMRLYGSMVCDSLIDPDKTQKELTIIRREAKMGIDSPSTAASTARLQSFFGAPHSSPVIGYFDQLCQYAPESVRNYYERAYTLGKITVISAGKAPLEKVVLYAEQYFGDSSLRPNEAADRNTDAYKVHKGKPGVYGIVNPTLQNSAVVQVSAFLSPDLYQKFFNRSTAATYNAARSLICQHFFSRLRVGKQLAYDCGFDENKTVHPETAYIYGIIDCDPEKIDLCRKELTETIKDARTIERAEMELQVSSTLGSILNSADDPGSRCGTVTSFIDNELPPEDTEQITERYKAVEQRDLVDAIDDIATAFEEADTFTHVISHADHLHGYELITAQQ